MSRRKSAAVSQAVGGLLLTTRTAVRPFRMPGKMVVVSISECSVSVGVTIWVRVSSYLDSFHDGLDAFQFHVNERHLL